MRGIQPVAPVWVSIGVIARNEAEAIGPALESIFRQTLFAELAALGLRAEVLCITNGCTDATPQIASAVLAEHSGRHPQRHAFQAWALDMKERGKLNAWNVFVHHVSAASSRYLILMDGDILLSHPATLWSLGRTLEERAEARISVGQPIKDIALRARPSWRERLSLGASRLTQGADAQLTGQLYCIRAEIARNIYLPRDLPACEDGFIKHVVCTDFLTGPLRPERIALAPDAAHVFEAYLSPGDILRNQKRQAIGQTFVHVLVDKFLPTLPIVQRVELGRTLWRLDDEDPRWLKRLVAEHLERVAHAWRLFPGVLTSRWRRMMRMSARNRLRHMPTAVVAWLMALPACWMAWRALRGGSSDYWPDTKSWHLRELAPAGMDGAGRKVKAATPPSGHG